METNAAPVIEIHNVSFGQAYTADQSLLKDVEKIYNQDTDSNACVEGNSDLETVLASTKSESTYEEVHTTMYEDVEYTAIPHHAVVKIVKQCNSYAPSIENSFNLSSIDTVTLVPTNTHLPDKAGISEVTIPEPDNGHSKINHEKQVSNVNQSPEKAPVIMFKWGSMKKPFRCQICDMSFSDGDLLRENLEKHKGSRKDQIKPFPCKLCTKSFQSNRSLERHQMLHSGQSQKRCKHCYKIFANKENLDKHLLMHSANACKTQSCPSCNEQFASPKQLEKHLGTHWHMKGYVCHVCDKKFARKDGLDRHLYTHDLGKKNKHQCVECSKSFMYLFALKRHVRSVHGGEPDGRTCEICGKFIKNKENIGRHMQLHNGERPYGCSKCGRKFTQKQHLIDHMVIHNNNLPFPCKICSYSFRYRRTLSRHMKKHIKVDREKQTYECVDCHVIYSSEEELVKHSKKTHYDLKICVICDETFSDDKARMRHMLKDHNSSDGVVNKNFVNKSTETDITFIECNTGSVGLGYKKVRELTSKNIETNAVNTVHSTEEEDVDIENDFIYPGENVESLLKKENIQIKYTDNGEGTDGQQVVYIVYDDGKMQSSKEETEVQQTGSQISEYLHAMKEETVVQQTGSQIPEYIQMQHKHCENETVQISVFGTQGNSCEVGENSLEESKTQAKEDMASNSMNRVLELEVDYPSLYQTSDSQSSVGNSSGKTALLAYNVAEKEDGTLENEEEKDYSAERFKLLQSLIDYAEKIQEEEQSITHNEGTGASETEI